MDFTHSAYLELLQLIKSLGRSIGTFHAVAHEAQFVILRHDVDFSLLRAVEMAELDNAAGVRSIFFVLLTSQYYNALSAEGAALVREIAAQGHEIGLHIDLTGFEQLAPAEQQRRIAQQADLLSTVAGQEVRCIAQHRPATTLVRVKCPQLLDAYEDRFVKDIGYISDSRRQFLMPDVVEFFQSHERSQLLTHPIWWTAEATTRSRILQRLGSEIAAAAVARLQAEDARIEARIQALSSGEGK